MKPSQIIKSLLLNGITLFAAYYGALAQEKEPLNIEEQTPASSSIRILDLPIIKPGRMATFRLVDSQGTPVPAMPVSINGRQQLSLENGKLSFLVPDLNSLSLELNGNQIKYSKNSSGLLSKISVQKITEKIWNGKESSKFPQIFYSSTTVEPSGELLILGNNLQKFGENTSVYVDGIKAEILALSPVSIRAKADPGLTPGMNREAYVTVGTSSSNITEMDVCKILIQIPEEPKDWDDSYEHSPETINISIVGSKLPGLLRCTNLSSNDLSFWLPNQQPMGKEAIFMSSGADHNSIKIGLKRKHGSLVKIAVSKEQDFDWQDKPEFQSTLFQTLEKELIYEQILLLKRQLISIQKEIINRKEQEDSNSEVLSSKLRAIELRRARISIMLEARRAIYAALGATDEEYRKSLDDATGGAYLNLESESQPLEFTPTVTVGSQATTAIKKARLLRFLEPPIKLLPPLDDIRKSPPATAKIASPVKVKTFSASSKKSSKHKINHKRRRHKR